MSDYYFKSNLVNLSCFFNDVLRTYMLPFTISTPVPPYKPSKEIPGSRQRELSFRVRSKGRFE